MKHIFKNHYISIHINRLAMLTMMIVIKMQKLEDEDKHREITIDMLIMTMMIFI